MNVFNERHSFKARMYDTGDSESRLNLNEIMRSKTAYGEKKILIRQKEL